MPEHPERVRLFDEAGTYPLLESFLEIEASKNLHAKYLWAFHWKTSSALVLLNSERLQLKNVFSN